MLSVTTNKSILREHATSFTLDIKVNLPVGAGIVGIFGHSGSGKSSLLKSIAGILDTDNAVVVYNKDDISTLTSDRRPIVYQGQDDLLFPHLSVKENLAFVLSHGLFKTAVPFSLQEVCNWVGIEHLLHQMPSSLSGGETQRVKLARSLLCGKPIILLDEPFSALDWRARTEMLHLLVHLQTQYQLHFVIVSHSLREMAICSHYLVHIEQGQLSAHGLTKDMVQQLSSEHDQPILSQLNVIFDEYLESYNITRWLLQGTKDSYIYSRGPTSFVNDGAVPLVVDAGSVSLSRNKNDNSSILNQLALNLVDIQEGSDSVICYLATDNLTNSLRAEISRLSFQRLKLKVGETVFAQFKAL